MLSEIAQWITPAIVILGFLFTARTIRNQRVELESWFGSRMDRMESRLAGRIDGVESQIGNLRDQMDSQTGNLRDRMESQTGELRSWMESQTSDLRDRMGRIEGTLDVLREYFVGTGRGTAA